MNHSHVLFATVLWLSVTGCTLFQPVSKTEQAPCASADQSVDCGNAIPVNAG